MPSFVYNPYSQTPPTLERSLKNLARSTSPPQLASIKYIHEQLVHQQKDDEVEWTIDLALDISSYVLNLASPSPNSSSISSKLLSEEGLLTFDAFVRGMLSKWDDEMMYAILVHEFNKNTPTFTRRENHYTTIIDMFLAVATSDTDLMSGIALIGISLSCRVLDRVQQLTTLDMEQTDISWWLGDEKSHELTASTALSCFEKQLKNSQRTSTTPPSTPCSQDELNTAVTSILSSLLKHDSTSWIEEMPDDKLAMFCQTLVRQTQPLMDSDLFNTKTYSIYSTLVSALSSASLLSLIEKKRKVELSDYNRMIHSSSLIENIVHILFESGVNDASLRNSSDDIEKHQLVQEYALDLLYCWCSTSSEGWSVIAKQESRWRPAVETFWKGTLENRFKEVQTLLPLMLMLHKSCRFATRQILFEAIERAGSCNGKGFDESCKTIVNSLFNAFGDTRFRNRDHTACFTRLLISDKMNVSTHDDLSRSFWKALHPPLIDTCMSAILNHSTNEDTRKPGLLIMIDLLNVLLSENVNCDVVLQNLDVQNLEKFIYLAEQKSIRIDFMDASEIPTDSDDETDTPTLHNLSRVDESSICVEHEDEKKPKGIDNAVRVSAATALARLAYHSTVPGDERNSLVLSRICSVVNNFLVNFHQQSDLSDIWSMSLDLSRRSFRLQLAVSTNENADFVATVLHTAKVQKVQQFSRLAAEKTRIQQRLDKEISKSTQLLGQNEEYVRQRKSQASIFRREIERVKSTSFQEAKQYVSIHAAARERAEKSISKFAEQTRIMESELAEAKISTETSMKAEAAAREEIQNMESELNEMRHQNQDLNRQLQMEEAKSNELSEDLQKKVEEFDSLRGAQSQLEREIHERDNAMVEVEDQKEALQDNLEDLFADMVSLAQMYQLKEEGEISNKKRADQMIDEVNAKLKRESQKNIEHTTTIENLRQENEKLYKKLGKYREKLQEERSQRQEESQRRKRTGPVSYINQLHTSTRDDRSRREHESHRKESSSDRISKERSQQGKENSYYYASSTSQRRKRY